MTRLMVHVVASIAWMLPSCAGHAMNFTLTGPGVVANGTFVTDYTTFNTVTYRS